MDRFLWISESLVILWALDYRYWPKMFQNFWPVLGRMDCQKDVTRPFSRTSVLPEAVSALLMRGLSGSRARRLGRWKTVGELLVNLPHDASLGRRTSDDQQQVACQPQ